jgi:hypothetical protein
MYVRKQSLIFVVLDPAIYPETFKGKSQFLNVLCFLLLKITGKDCKIKLVA